jgi:uncharacterized spore protein YtfJ
MATFTKEKKTLIEEQNIAQPATDQVEQVLTHMLDVVRVNAVFGQAVERGNTTVIPCSEVIAGLGMGSGSGPFDERGNPAGGGSGGGGGAKARPIAAIIIAQDGVHVEPIMDITKVALATITTGAFVLFWLGRLRRISRPGKDSSFKKLKKAINA